MRADAAFFAPQAWVDGAWAFDVRLDVAADGTWRAITPQGSAQGATVLDGPGAAGHGQCPQPCLPARLAGLTEQGSGTDDFWSWRDRMYRVALRITPEQLEAMATQLYAELLAGGYTQVCEFHYLHNDRTAALCRPAGRCPGAGARRRPPASA
jgi:formimidoylglutamate deiminase